MLFIKYFNLIIYHKELFCQFLLQDTIVMQSSVLALTDLAVLPISAVLNAIKMIKNEGLEQIDPLIITQASVLSMFLILHYKFKNPMFQLTNYMHISIFLVDMSAASGFVICGSFEFPGDQLFGEISSVLRPGGMVLLQQLLLLCLTKHGFEFVSFSQQIKARKPSWKIGSSFSLKSKPAKSLPKVQIDDDMDLIDEDSLLTEEDLKKPQLPPIGDCEVSSMRKACKNCTCGRAEEEEKVQKLGLTRDQLNNPQSACGSCGLGDAFRCGTCPYRGLPPFKLGDKVRFKIESSLKSSLFFSLLFFCLYSNEMPNMNEFTGYSFWELSCGGHLRD
ncbi:hypothetical protein HYC85_025055 [Camellia sinensis]|uniref:Anamorsin homolog n=1 Tax=Camellia sinensis TaxID=4442 RepID=A0A7J7G9Y2_CAMSI|nr:hypothetical protein HYC85_025055 [Camellia sinensis]